MKPLRDPALLGACAATLLSLALQLSSGMYDPVALVIATVACALAIGATFGREPGVVPAQLALGAGIVYGLYCHVFLVPTFYGQQGMLPGFRGLALFAALFLSAYTCRHLRGSLRALRFWGMLAIAVAMGLATIHYSPRPFIDVWYVRVIAGRALRHGIDPYAFGYPNIYGADGVRLYGDVMRNGRVWAFPYPPLIPLLDALTGADPRYMNLAGMAVSAWALSRIGLTGEIAAGLLLFQGRTFFVLEQTWTEPITLAAFCVALLFCVRPPRRVSPWIAIGIPLGICAASKQYSPLLVAALVAAAPRGHRLRAGFLGLAIVLATMLPFAMWDWHAFSSGLFLNHVHGGLRPESLSLPAAWGRVAPLPPWTFALQLVAAFTILGVSLWRSSVPRIATGAAAAMLTLVLLSQQAFCNYDWLGGGLLCAAVATWARTKETAQA